MKKPKVRLDLDELLDYMDERKKYDGQFDVMAVDDRLSFNDVMAYVELCNLSPSPPPAEQVLTILQGLGHEEFNDVTRRMAIEMMFFIRLP